MNHDAELKLQAYVDGELPEREAAEVRDWLARDADARALLTELQNTGAALKGNETGVKLPETREFYWSKIARDIERAERPATAGQGSNWMAWLTRSLVPAGGVALLACVLLIFLAQPAKVPSREGEMELASDDMGAYTFRDQQERITVVWFYDRKGDSQFTPPPAFASVGGR